MTPLAARVESWLTGSRSAAPHRPSPVAVLWCVIALTVLAAVLRALAVSQSTWGDELFLYEIVHDRGLRDAMSVVHDTESTPPFYFVVAWLAARIGENDFLLIRLPAL